MICPQAHSTQAWLDGELDSERSGAAGLHASTCVECNALIELQRETREHLLTTVGAIRAPASLRSRVRQSIREAEATTRTDKPRWRLPVFWLGAGTGGVCSALLIAVLWAAQIWLTETSLVATLVQEHSSALLSDRLVAVQSSEHHTVKPLFASHADVSPVVEDFSTQGFRLIGGRVAGVQRQRAAVAIYGQGAHLISVFSWVSDAHPLTGEYSKRGFNLNCWTRLDVQYCAISDVNTAALRELRELLSAQD